MKPLPFSETLARPGVPLQDHLLAVAREASLALATAPPILRLLALVAGLCHDLGKATTYFQQWRLVQGRCDPRTCHARLSAILFLWFSQGLLQNNREYHWHARLWGTVMILRHHGDLRENWLDTLVRLKEGLADDPVITAQLAAMDLDGAVRWLMDRVRILDVPWEPFFRFPVQGEDILAAIRQVNVLRLKMTLANGRMEEDLAGSTKFLAAFGALLAADKVDAALAGGAIARPSLPPNLVASFKRDRFADRPRDTMQRLRDEIAATVRRNLLENRQQHHFTLTAPTGSGKTLTALEAVLALREAMAAETRPAARIIYCLPFTSVIDQNHQVFRDVLAHGDLPDSQDILLKHHHLAETRYRTVSDGEYGVDDDIGQLLTETWQSEIVVTTFHQLLHSFFSGRNSNLKRTARLAGGIVILDEVQAIPLRYWEAVRRLLHSLAENLDTRFILMTATRPLIYRSARDAIELLPQHGRYFASLCRLRLHNRSDHPTGLREFVRLAVHRYRQEPRSTLVVLNRRKTVRQLYALFRESVPDAPVLALSTDLTPLDRRKRIDRIRHLLAAEEPAIVISTQLVEAGVDLSFSVVHRDLAPLDCIIQSCGRCNRHNEGEPGRVYLWNLYDEEKGEAASQWRQVYDAALIEATVEALAGEREIGEDRFLPLTERYFQMCQQRSEQSRVDTLLAKGEFSRLETEFRLIEDGPPTVSMFVIQNDVDRKLWARYLALDEIDTADRRREFRRFRFAFFERVIQVRGTVSRDDAVLPLEAAAGSYDPATGFVGLQVNEDESTCMI